MELTTQNKKYLKIAGVTVGLGFLAWYFMRNKADNGGGTTDPTGNGDNGGSTYVFKASTVAEELYQAMKSLGTDEDSIFASLKNVNQSQFAEVIKAFGSRTYNTYSGTSSGGFNAYPLKKWLFEELSDDQYKTLKLKYPNHL